MTEDNVYFYLTNKNSVYFFLTEGDKEDKKCYGKFYNYLLTSRYLKNQSDEIIIMEIAGDKLNIIKISNNNSLLSSLNDYSAEVVFTLFKKITSLPSTMTRLLTFTNYKAKTATVVLEGLENFKDTILGEEYRIYVCDDEYWWQEI